MHYVGSELSKGVTFHEKHNIDISNIKTKLDNNSKNLTLKMTNLAKSNNEYTEKCVNNLENKINSSLNIHNEKLLTIRIENISYADEMKKTTENLLKELNKVILIKNELFNKFEEQINFVRKDNSRVIKCFTGYKEQFYEMRKKFVDLSNFFKYGNYNKRELYRGPVNLNPSKGNKILEGNNTFKINKRKSAEFRVDVNRLLIKYDGKVPHKSNKENNKSIKNEETVYEKFLKDYKRTESQLAVLDKKNKLEIIHNKNITYRNDSLINENELVENKDLEYKNHEHHNHHSKKSNKNQNYDDRIKYNKDGEFIRRRKARLTTISPTNNKLNIPLSKLFELAYNNNNNNDNNDGKTEKKIINKKFKRLITQKLDNLEKPLKKLENLFNNKSIDSKRSSTNSIKNISKLSSSSSVSSNSKSSKSNSNSNNKKTYFNKNKYEKNEIIKEEENYNSIQNIERKSRNKIVKEINNLKVDKEAQIENKIIKKENNIKIEKSKAKKVKFLQIKNFNSNSKENLIKNYNKTEGNLNNENDINYLITNYNEKNNKNIFYRKNNSYKSPKQKNFFVSNSLQKITISLEGSKKLEINPKSKENTKAQKEIIQNVNTIINNNFNNKNSNLIQNKTFNGFPKIITNNGERVIFSSHPVYNSKKFTNYINPNVLALNYSIQTLFGNKIKKMKKQKTNTFNNLKNDNNYSDAILNKKLENHKQKMKEYENDNMNNNYLFITNEKLNTERPKIPFFNEFNNKKDSSIRTKNYSNDNFKNKSDFYYNYNKK